MRPVAEHAIVLGGSMAGLVTAAALADRFDRVTVVERDRLPGVGEHRRGVPQGRHAHALLARGQGALVELFPGLLEDLRAAGAEILSDPAATRLHLGGGMLRQVALGLDNVIASRPLLEGVVRERVRAVPNITFLEGYRAVRLLTSDDRTRTPGAGRRLTGFAAGGVRAGDRGRPLARDPRGVPRRAPGRRPRRVRRVRGHAVLDRGGSA